MTLNEDRKQTKYGHKRWEHMTHTRQRTDTGAFWSFLTEKFYVLFFNNFLYFIGMVQHLVNVLGLAM